MSDKINSQLWGQRSPPQTRAASPWLPSRVQGERQHEMWLSLSAQSELGEFWSLMQETGMASLPFRMRSSRISYSLFGTVVAGGGEEETQMLRAKSEAPRGSETISLSSTANLGLTSLLDSSTFPCQVPGGKDAERGPQDKVLVSNLGDRDPDGHRGTWEALEILRIPGTGFQRAGHLEPWLQV